MGLFDGLKTMVDIVKAGVEAVKATDKMDEVVEKVREDYKKQLTDDEKALLKQYRTLKKKHEETEDLDEANAMIEDVEKAEVEFLMAVTQNPELPDDLKDEMKAAVEGYIRANDAPMEIIEKRFMKMAKTDEEKDFVRQLMEEAKDDAKD